MVGRGWVPWQCPQHLPCRAEAGKEQVFAALHKGCSFPKITPGDAAAWCWVFPVTLSLLKASPWAGGALLMAPSPLSSALPAPLREGVQPKGHGGGWGFLGDTGSLRGGGAGVAPGTVGMWSTVIPGRCQALCTPKGDSPRRVRAVPGPSTLQGPQPGPEEASHQHPGLLLAGDDVSDLRGSCFGCKGGG